jgi:ATP/maltotriose-dependent transcriptional regulator MalT
MSNDRDLQEEELKYSLETIATQVLSAAERCEGDCDRLLALLRTLEGLHRKIREEIFEVSLPDNRKELYHFLRDVEEAGGWPYIERMKIQQLLKNCQEILPITEPPIQD